MEQRAQGEGLVLQHQLPGEQLCEGQHIGNYRRRVLRVGLRLDHQIGHVGGQTSALRRVLSDNLEQSRLCVLVAP